MEVAISGKILKAMKAMSLKGGRGESRIGMTSVWCDSGRFYATDSFVLARVIPKKDISPNEERFMIHPQAFEYVKARDLVVVDEKTCSFGDLSFDHVFGCNSPANVDSLIDGGSRDGAFPWEDAVINPALLEKACKIASAIGGNMKIEGRGSRMFINANGDDFIANIVVMAAYYPGAKSIK